MADEEEEEKAAAASGTVTLFGKYEVGRLLGCGAFAKVYHARDVRTGQSVAIKSVSKRKILKGGFVAHVKREISIMRRVRHPNIVKLIEVLATRSRIYFVIEFAKGGELFVKLTRGRFSEDLSRKYFQQLISAVGYCHSRGVFHRDLKPENLLLDDNLNLKVSDFGLSAVRDQVEPDGLLHTLCGTPAYVAPEILAKKGYDGAKVDVWSCGVILFVLVAGYLPFNDTNLMALYRKIFKGEFRCPKWASPELKHILSRVLDTNPETRITLSEIIQDPWFNQDYKAVSPEDRVDDFDLKVNNNNNDNVNDDNNKSSFVNAFEIISLSPGLDLSGLFGEDSGFSTRFDRFLSTEPPSTILEGVEEEAKKEGLAVTKRMDWGAKLEGHNGKFTRTVLVVEIHPITDKLVVVNVKEREEVGEVETTLGVWKDKIKPNLDGLVYDDNKRGRGGAVTSLNFLTQ